MRAILAQKKNNAIRIQRNPLWAETVRTTNNKRVPDLSKSLAKPRLEEASGTKPGANSYLAGPVNHYESVASYDKAEVPLGSR